MRVRASWTSELVRSTGGWGVGGAECPSCDAVWAAGISSGPQESQWDHRDAVLVAVGKLTGCENDSVDKVVAQSFAKPTQVFGVVSPGRR